MDKCLKIETWNIYENYYTWHSFCHFLQFLSGKPDSFYKGNCIPFVVPPFHHVIARKKQFAILRGFWCDFDGLLMKFSILHWTIGHKLFHFAHWTVVVSVKRRSRSDVGQSVSQSVIVKNWLDWCDPGEWWYLLKTLLTWLWEFLTYLTYFPYLTYLPTSPTSPISHTWPTWPFLTYLTYLAYLAYPAYLSYPAYLA